MNIIHIALYNKKTIIAKQYLTENIDGKIKKLYVPVASINLKDVEMKFEENFSLGKGCPTTFDLKFIEKNKEDIQHSNHKNYAGYCNDFSEMMNVMVRVKRDEIKGGDYEQSLERLFQDYLTEMYEHFQKQKLKSITKDTLSMIDTISNNMSKLSMLYSTNWKSEDYNSPSESLRDLALMAAKIKHITSEIKSSKGVEAAEFNELVSNFTDDINNKEKEAKEAKERRNKYL